MGLRVNWIYLHRSCFSVKNKHLKNLIQEMVPCAIKSESILKIITAFLSFLIKPIRVLQNWQLLQTSLFQKKLLLSSSDSLLLLLEGR